ncbi:TPA: integrase arm-type DNA-binding domain-containing protein [Salmonella enterica subsp. enterica serovar Paratyphi B]|uniref:Integrase arm-type DNA-binding domain-containing protein n=1 Tax=Salmonella enterica subsp. enterica serovar Paratyphi B str. CFSAN000540 TaxID=1299076 RepID=A0A8E6KSF9_SALEB|nr:integrase domain-containing protein [Salmonella enterica]QVQ09556.1 integrase arm-type DNA-binding domain-containing protein [Salmonella enterica subsp. enterica serovar Paratyphi B str. CFSAN000540]HCB5887228.1 integrase arm-type DNA-binding domain-containing protein [Salmonella enterica subsp. enterica serovar Paratyphi B]HCM8897886.1 integrase arm-type DNA-binding domain-containing protein [Salmonella enterica subsp. enterica serovar Paratyphi B]
MPKVATKLTDTEIKKAKPTEKEFTLWDGDGLFLRIKPSGKKIWHLGYTVPLTKKRAKMSLGFYPYLTLAQARALRDEYLSLLAQGIDPQSHNEQKAQALKDATEHTFQTVAKKWLDEKIKTSGISQDHAKDIWRSLERNIFPTLGDIPIKEIRPKMLKQHLDPIEQRGVLETLRRIISRLNEIFRYAATEELIEFNPADNLTQRFSKPKKQNMPALPPSELPRFIVALANASIRLETRLLIEWQLLTWVRPGEAVRARWTDIDEENRFWNIPAEFMKMKRPHKVPLSKEAMRILESMKPISGHREWVFPSIKAPLSHMHEQTANAAIIRMGFGGEMVAHGMRSIARTAAEESSKFRTEVLEAALAHSKRDEIVAAYNRAEYLAERVALMQWWGDYVLTQKMKSLAA